MEILILQVLIGLSFVGVQFVVMVLHKKAASQIGLLLRDAITKASELRALVDKQKALPGEIADACEQLCWILLFVEKARKEKHLQTLWNWREITEALPHIDRVQQMIDEAKADGKVD